MDGWDLPELFHRRGLFHRVSGGISAAAIAHLLGEDSSLRATEVPHGDLKPRIPHFTSKATSVIHLFMNGGPSQMDLFDPKPILDKHHGQSYFDKIAGEVEKPQSAGALMRSPFAFKQRGQLPDAERQDDSGPPDTRLVGGLWTWE